MIKMREYKDYIGEMKNKWVGKTVFYESNRYKVVGVDYNGQLLIGKKTKFTDTTAVSSLWVEVME